MMDENLAGTQIVMTNNSEIIERNRLQLLHTVNLALIYSLFIYLFIFL